MCGKTKIQGNQESAFDYYLWKDDADRVILIVVDFWKQQNKAKSIDDNTIVYDGRLVHNLFLCVNKRTKQKI